MPWHHVTVQFTRDRVYPTAFKPFIITAGVIYFIGASQRWPPNCWPVYAVILNLYKERWPSPNILKFRSSWPTGIKAEFLIFQERSQGNSWFLGGWRRNVTETMRFSEGSFTPPLFPWDLASFWKPEGHTRFMNSRYCKFAKGPMCGWQQQSPWSFPSKQKGPVLNTVPFLPRYKGAAFFLNAWRGSLEQNSHPRVLHTGSDCERESS